MTSRARRVADIILEDPRGRRPSLWLDKLRFLVDRLAAATESRVELGAYWCHDEPGHASASICSRVRARDPLPGVSSDYWEGCLCLSGGEGQSVAAWASADLFPYRNGSLVTPAGRLADLPEGAECDRFRAYVFDGASFDGLGWRYPDGPGEWSWVREPGDEYWQDLKPRSDSADPLLLSIEVGEPTIKDLRSGRGSLAFSLLHVSRGRAEKKLHKRDEKVAIAVGNISGAGAVRLDLRRFAIKGGWKPERYNLALRSHGRGAGAWSFRSDISAPFRLGL